MSLISFVFFIVSKKSTLQLKNQETCFQSKLISIEKGMIKYFVQKLCNNHYSIQSLIIFRDNGITIQIMTYQLYIELTIFLVILIFAVIWNHILVEKTLGCMVNFGIFVVQPLFYLNGDVNFRNRVQNQGYLKALKKELFQMN